MSVWDKDRDKDGDKDGDGESSDEDFFTYIKYPYNRPSSPTWILDTAGEEIQRMHDVHRRRKKHARKLPQLPKLDNCRSKNSLDPLKDEGEGKTSSTEQHQELPRNENQEFIQEELQESTQEEHRYENCPGSTTHGEEDVYEEIVFRNKHHNSDSFSGNNDQPSLQAELAFSQKKVSHEVSQLSLADELHAIGNELDIIAKTKLCKEFVQKISVSECHDLGSPEVIDPRSYRDSGFIECSSSSSHDMSSSAETTALTVAVRRPLQRDGTTQTEELTALDDRNCQGHMSTLTCQGQQTSSSTRTSAGPHCQVTHRCCYKFVPRHSEELFLEIGDPIYVEDEAEDLWCSGVNLRTKESGVFPAVCSTDLSFLEGDATILKATFYLQYLGSIEVTYHGGMDVLCQAIHRVTLARRQAGDKPTPTSVYLDITESGINMAEQDNQYLSAPHHNKEKGVMGTLSRIFNRTSSAKRTGPIQNFFSLQNISFCGSHPKNDRYFAFITKHPLEVRFACHVLFAEQSTQHICEAVGAAFRTYYQQYLAATHPTEDIYLE